LEGRNPSLLEDGAGIPRYRSRLELLRCFAQRHRFVTGRPLVDTHALRLWRLERQTDLFHAVLGFTHEECDPSMTFRIARREVLRQHFGVGRLQALEFLLELGAQVHGALLLDGVLLRARRRLVVRTLAIAVHDGEVSTLVTVL